VNKARWLTSVRCEFKYELVDVKGCGCASLHEENIQIYMVINHWRKTVVRSLELFCVFNEFNVGCCS
jgi:hypothetical protein